MGAADGPAALARGVGKLQGVSGRGAAWGGRDLGRRGGAEAEGGAARGRATSRRGARSGPKLFQLRPLQAHFSLKF
jgi:hypothetical protein